MSESFALCTKFENKAVIKPYTEELKVFEKGSAAYKESAT